MVLFFGVFCSHAQTQFWSDTFEDAGAPSSGTRTPENNSGTGGPPFTAYFVRAINSDIQTMFSPSGYVSFEGSKFWAGEDQDTPFGAANVEQEINWTGINVSGKTGLSFRGLFAANNINAAFENNILSGGASNSDYVIVEYRFNGTGGYTTLLGFFANNNVGSGANNKSLALDTDGDGIGNTPILSGTFAEIQGNIVGTGNTLDIRIRAYSNGTSEEWAIDNFRLFETPACVAPTITGQPGNKSVCNNGTTTYTISSTNTTSYQWQVNTGSGFVDITNGGIYSNATTSTLTITGATSGMNGYLYRCVAYNGPLTCFTNSNSASLTVSLPSISNASQTNVACNGGSNGAAQVNAATGGIGPYTYNWTPGNPTGDGTTSVTGLTAGTWTCTVIDAIGCTASTNFTITQPTALVLNANSQTNVACNGGSNGAASVSAASGGSGGYTYNWTPGNPTGDGTTAVTGLTAGTWTCTVTDANGCTAVRNFTVTQPTALVATAASQTNISCNGGSNGAASINTPTGGAGGYTYNWTPGNPIGDGTTSVSALSAGTWTCTITDANSCTTSVNFTITQPTALALNPSSQTNIACFGGNTGAASVTAATGGAGGYTYNWTPGNPTGDGTTSVTGLSAGTWTCTVTDANGCTASRNFTITQPASAVSGTTVVTNIACNGGNTGAINLTPTGGVGPYTFNWADGPTSEDRTGLTAGPYSVTITDANGCTGTVNATVTQPAAAVSGTTVVTNVACFGGNTGAINLTPTGGVGPYTFNWAGGPTTEDRTTLTAGPYSVTITDANGCTGTVNATVTQPAAAVSGTTVVTNIACNGGNTGAINLTPTGGVGPYTFNWVDGPTTEDRTGLTAGPYSVTITDANGCTGTVNVTVTQPTALAASAASQSNVSCNGGANGTASINSPTGGAGGYTYNWTPGNPIGDGTTSVIGLTAGTWTCTITDANSCTTSVNFTITQPSTLAATAASQTNVSCNGGNNGAASINTPTGGAGGYTYDWTPGNPTGDGTTSVTGLGAGNWTCTITDANSCTTSVNFTITEPTAVDSSVTQSAGVLTATQSGATYQWYSCPNTLLTGETNQTFTPTVVGDYKAEISVGGCTVTSPCITVTTLGTSNFELLSQFKMYPNPNNGILNIETETDGDFIIINQLGQIVERFTAKANTKTTINIEKLSEGTYFVKGNKGTNIPTKKLVIKK